jgi:Flp pilus assembly protein TadG
MTAVRASRVDRGRGQALVEFSLALLPFVLILMGVVDLGRGIYMNSGTSQAAREIARVTAVHQGATFGSSAETLSVISTQKNLVPGLGDAAATIAITCTTVTDVNVPVAAGSTCPRSNFVKVSITVPFAVITPLLSMVAPSTLSASAHIQVP